MAEIFLARQDGAAGLREAGGDQADPAAPRRANREFVAMFLDEARLAAQLTHPNVVADLRRRPHEGTYFIAMEYIHGPRPRRMILPSAGQPASACRIERRRRGRSSRRCGGPRTTPTAKQTSPGEPLQHRPPRRQPAERARHLRRGGEGRRLRHRQGQGRVGPDRQRRIKGKVAVHVARAVPGRVHRCAVRCLRVGVILHELVTGTRLFKRNTDYATMLAVAETQVPPLRPAGPEHCPRSWSGSS